MYRYLGNERLQWFFDTPNIFGAFIVPLLLLAAGIFLFAAAGKNRWPRIAAWGAILPAAAFGMLLLAFSYSRGAYVAAGAAFVAGALFARNRLAWIFPLLLLAALLLTADGVSRVASMTALGDGSIRNRLLLWDGGCALISSHPLGLPSGAVPGTLYSQLYKPLWLAPGYASLISDPLTIAAIYGLPVLFGIWTLAGWIFSHGARRLRRNRNPILLYSLLAIGAFMICGIFSTFYSSDNVLWPTIAATLIAAAFIIHGFVTGTAGRKTIDWYLPPIIAAAAAAMIFAYGGFVRLTTPSRFVRADVGNRLLEPRYEPPIARILTLTRGTPEEMFIVLRPLAESGLAAEEISLEAGFSSLPDAAAKIRAAVADSSRPGMPLYLLGTDPEASLQALALAAETGIAEKISGIIVINSPAEWPFEQLSPPLLLPRIKAPLLLIATSEARADADALAACAAATSPRPVRRFDADSKQMRLHDSRTIAEIKRFVGEKHQ